MVGVPGAWAVGPAFGAALVLALGGFVVQLSAPAHEVRGTVVGSTSDGSSGSVPATVDIAYSPDGRKVYHLYVPDRASYGNGITGVNVIYEPADPARAHASSTSVDDLSCHGQFLYAAALVLALLGGWWAWRHRRLHPT